MQRLDQSASDVHRRLNGDLTKVHEDKLALEAGVISPLMALLANIRRGRMAFECLHTDNFLLKVLKIYLIILPHFTRSYS